MSFTRAEIQTKRLDLGNDRMVFRRVRGRVIPVRIGMGERIATALRNSVAPAAVAAGLGEVLAAGVANRKAGRKLFSVGGALAHFKTPGAWKAMGKVAALTVAFSVGYAALFGRRQKHIVELDKAPKPKGKARIWLGSKPGFVPGHHLGEHSYLHVRDKYGKTTAFGGQIKNPAMYGSSGVKLVRNFPTDKISKAHNIHDLTPERTDEANAAVRRVLKEADKLGADLKAKDYKYRSIPIRKNRYNSNSVTGTLVRRANLDFRHDRRRHNLPGFNRTIPRG